jgi:3-dehydroquinate synthase
LAAPVEERRIPVAASRAYEVVIGSEIDAGPIVAESAGTGDAVILTDSNAGPLYAAALARSLERAGVKVTDTIEIPAGESSKSLENYGGILSRLARAGVTRDATLVALGGGVVGDLGGFVAASYLRGIGFVLVPTSLLAMVDSSVGGKVGVDLPEGKNLAGAFLQPNAVVADAKMLSTLPERELSCGLAEVVKMGLLSGRGFYQDLSRLREARGGDEEALRSLVGHSIRFKAGVVAEDEREGGRRAILNYGHTIGHGIEAAAGYTLAHGEAVGVGMRAAARISEERLGASLAEEQDELLRSAGLPLRAEGVDPEAVLRAMGRDKKRRSGDAGHRFVLLEEVGRPVWGVEVTDDEAERAVEAVVG